MSLKMEDNGKWKIKIFDVPVYIYFFINQKNL